MQGLQTTVCILSKPACNTYTWTHWKILASNISHVCIKIQSTAKSSTLINVHTWSFTWLPVIYYKFTILDFFINVQTICPKVIKYVICRHETATAYNLYKVIRLYTYEACMYHLNKQEAWCRFSYATSGSNNHSY